MEISNFLNYDYNLNSKQKEKNPENSEMEEHEIKLERVSQGSYNNIPNFKMFNDNNLFNLNKNTRSKNKSSSILKAFENNTNNSNGIRTNYNKSIIINNSNNQIFNTKRDNFAKEKGLEYKQTFSSAHNYSSSELNEFAININNYNNQSSSNRQRNDNKDTTKNYDNYDYNNLPVAFAEKRNSINTDRTIMKSVNNINSKDYQEKTIKADSNFLVDLEYNLYLKTNFDNSQEDLEKRGKIRVEENLTHNKRSRPDCRSPHESNSNMVISLNNTNNYNYCDEEDEEEESKLNILVNSAMKSRKNKVCKRNTRTHKNMNSKGSFNENKCNSTNLNHIKHDSDEIIDLNSLDSASPQDFEHINYYDELKNYRNISDNNNYNIKSKLEYKDDKVNYSSKIISKKEKSCSKQEIEIQVDLYDEQRELRQVSIPTYENNEKQERKNESKRKDTFAYLTPEKAKNELDSFNLIKIRNHNKISTSSLLKNSKMASYYCYGKPSDNESKDSKEQDLEREEQLRFFFENNQATMHNIYDLDFINNLLEKENKCRPDMNYFSNHPCLTLEHRAILVDWIMEICEDLAFKRDTLHFAVNYLDRFLSKTENIEKNILQLIGVSCLSIAGKFEVKIY